jgi:hypothetical protein
MGVPLSSCGLPGDDESVVSDLPLEGIAFAVFDWAIVFSCSRNDP